MAIYAALIRSRVAFAQATYGDGEWRSILGTGVGKNDQGESYSPELRESLVRTLEVPVGLWGVLWPGRAGADTHARAQAYIAEHNPPISWIPFRPISWAVVMGLAAPFFEALRTRPVVLVGPEHLSKLPARLVGLTEFIATPRIDSWRAADAIADGAAEVAHDGDVIIVCSGQGGTLMVHRLAELAGNYHSGWSILDLGSALDPFVGVLSRRIHRVPGWVENVMPKNFPRP